eukprot:m.43478 g.43478  ORF g.43478 m.43478 type:complete len:493 (-) comp12223_c0_seq4:1533-3011(-)
MAIAAAGATTAAATIIAAAAIAAAIAAASGAPIVADEESRAGGTASQPTRDVASPASAARSLAIWRRTAGPPTPSRRFFDGTDGVGSPIAPLRATRPTTAETGGVAHDQSLATPQRPAASTVITAAAAGHAPPAMHTPSALHSTSLSSPNNQLITLSGSIKGRDLQLLLDSGCEECLLHYDWAIANNIQLPLAAKLLSFKTADGKSEQCETWRIDLPLALGSFSERRSFLVVRKLAFPAIIGMPFLTQYNPVVDWQSASITFPSGRRQHRIQGQRLESPPADRLAYSAAQVSEHNILAEISPDHFRRMVDKGAEGFLVFMRRSEHGPDPITVASTLVTSTAPLRPDDDDVDEAPAFASTAPSAATAPTSAAGTAATATQPKLEFDIRLTDPVERAQMQQLLSEFESVFQTPTQTPAPRPGLDHEIDLLAGAQPFAVPPMRLNPVETEALRNILQDWWERGIIQESNSRYGAGIFLVKKEDPARPTSAVAGLL